ncbi:MAG: SRPBCC family protein [Pseudomonadales bacterium]
MLKASLKILLLLLLVLLAAGWVFCSGLEDRVTAVHGEKILELPRAEAWTKLQDLTLAHFYVPGIIKTEIVTEQTVGVGASRRVYQETDDYLNETVIDWVEGQGFTLRLHRDNGSAPFPFQQASYTYHLRDSGNGHTRVDTTLEYAMGAGCLGYWLDKLYLHNVLQSRADEVPAALKRFYEAANR